MATYSVLPDTLDLFFVSGDEVSILLDFDQDLTGYQFQVGIYEVSEMAANGAVIGTDEFSENFTISTVNLADGKIALSLTEAESSEFDPAVQYRWFLRWIAPGVVTRTVISGTISARLP